MSIRPGLSARATLEVRSGDTANQLGSGDVDVLATPILIALCEQASYLAAAPELGPGMTTVGMRVQFDHLAPVAVGGMVTAEATLDKIEGRRLTFTVSASDRAGLVGAGKVTRVVVEVEHFLKKAH
ncbi:MAG: thioesterase family protein [Acidimicrobiales bacterium]